MRLLRTLNIFSCVLLGMFLLTARIGGAEAEIPHVYKGPNPHTDSSDCSLCHVAPVEKLRGWFVLGSTKRELVADPTALCLKCHSASFGHAGGKIPKQNLADLPLGTDGTINCALTCHNMHIKNADNNGQERLHLRLVGDSLCNSCHDK